MHPVITISLDLLVLATLGAAIFYCFRLSRQFERMQADRKAFETLIQALNAAASRAEVAIRTLKEAAMGGADSLQEKTGKARALSDELEIMIEAGDSLANRLQSLAEKSRRVNMPDEADADDSPQPRSRAERELLEALRAKQKS